MEINQNLSVKELIERVEEENETEKKPIRWTKIIWSFISFLISLADISLVIYVSYLHFRNSSDIVAWLMLLPILLNFIGIFTFLSE